MRSLFTPEERVFAERVALLLTTNPFLPARVELEGLLLGAAYLEAGPVWSLRANVTASHENVLRIGVLVRELIDRIAARVAGRRRPAISDADRALYADFALYFLYDSHDLRLQALIGAPPRRVELYDDFVLAYDAVVKIVGPVLPPVGHLFACFYQIRRAFHFIYTNLLGSSLPAALLRAATWRAIFSRALRVYVQTFYRTQDAISLLVTGPTGSGKELVAATVGASRYLPFDTKTHAFPAVHDAGYHAFNLSECAQSVLESELFGHRRGAFTGAVEDKPGLFALPGHGGTLFLDEIGELHLDVQSKLLRVLQTRRYRPVGGVQVQEFAGKLVTATHRDLKALIRSGAFREDLYYRICGDRILTPSLRAQLDDAPGERRNLACMFATKLLGLEYAEEHADELDASFEATLPPNYPWPGNMRELEQRVGLLLMQGDQQPRETEDSGPPDPHAEDLGRPFVEGKMRADEAARRYATIVVANEGDYSKAARQLGVDRRTVAGMIDEELLARLKARGR